LLDDLKKIKKAFLTEQEQSGKKGKGNPCNSGKHKMVTIHEPIPKKPLTNAKHCTLCKKHGGTHATHNTLDCHKYDKDSKIKKSFGKGQRGSMPSDNKTASACAQLLEKISKLEKANEKLKKSSCKCKRNYSSDRDDSNSS
jgi:hypothetical protein